MVTLGLSSLWVSTSMLESCYCYQRLFLMDLLVRTCHKHLHVFRVNFLAVLPAILLLSISSYNQIAVYLKWSLNCSCWFGHVVSGYTVEANQDDFRSIMNCLEGQGKGIYMEVDFNLRSVWIQFILLKTENTIAK